MKTLGNRYHLEKTDPTFSSSSLSLSLRYTTDIYFPFQTLTNVDLRDSVLTELVSISLGVSDVNVLLIINWKHQAGFVKVAYVCSAAIFFTATVFNITTVESKRYSCMTNSKSLPQEELLHSPIELFTYFNVLFFRQKNCTVLDQNHQQSLRGIDKRRSGIGNML